MYYPCSDGETEPTVPPPAPVSRRGTMLTISQGGGVGPSYPEFERFEGGHSR
jgi:hypothetical protein